MLKVTNGTMTFTVTRGAYNNFYKHRGFSVVEADETGNFTGVGDTTPHDENADLEDSAQPKMDEEDGYDEEEEDLSEIPLNDMSFSQLCAYAEQLDLDYTGIKTKKDLRQFIREHLG